MINTERTEIRNWKYIVLIPVLSAGFLMASAQGQLTKVEGTFPNELNFPQEVKMLLETVENYTLPDGTLRTKLTDLEDWRAKNPDAKFYIEKFDYSKGMATSKSIKAGDEAAIEQYKKEYNKAEGFQSYAAVVNKPGANHDDEYAYIIHGITDHKVERISAANWENRTYLPYSGGPEAMNAYLAKTIKYPATAVANKVEGTVLISFVVDTGGNVTDPYVYKGIGYGCDEEALAAVAGLKWRPGMQNGRRVDVRCTVPVNFKLPQVEEQK
ncbi:MAG TPA: energy transducer TonB [Cyclobacteriaceae bacterium]|jgi:TonB family protein|nr:energy transducer TonB [Cyclobacteriaceae bacterium]